MTERYPIFRSLAPLGVILAVLALVTIGEAARAGGCRQAAERERRGGDAPDLNAQQPTRRLHHRDAVRSRGLARRCPEPGS